MQKIESVQRVEDKSAISVLGYEIFLMTVTELSGDVADGEMGVAKFADGVYPPLYTFGCATRDPHSGEYVDRTIPSLSYIGKIIFKLSDEDASIHEKYILDIAQQLGLYIVPVENGVVISHQLFQNIAVTNPENTWESIANAAETNRDFKVAMSGMGAATALGKAIEIGISRYNKIHMNDKVGEIIDIIKDIRFINDAGNESTLTLSGVDNILSTVKDKLTISSI